jgi:hypothetical protein
MRLIPIPAELNLGCTTCGQQSEVAVVIDVDRSDEIVATACHEHNTLEVR